jgi:hypothetical protein
MVRRNSGSIVAAHGSIDLAPREHGDPRPSHEHRRAESELRSHERASEVGEQHAAAGRDGFQEQGGPSRCRARGIVESSAQSPQSTLNAALDRRHRHAESSRDLLWAEVRVESQQHAGSTRLFQLEHQLRHVALHGNALDEHVGRFDRSRTSFGLLARAPTAFAADPLALEIARDGREPESDLAGVVGPMLERDDTGVLGQVLGQSGLTDELTCQGGQPVEMREQVFGVDALDGLSGHRETRMPSAPDPDSESRQKESGLRRRHAACGARAGTGAGCRGAPDAWPRGWPEGYAQAGSIPCRTPIERMLDEHRRPYFLWDVDMTLERFQEQLRGDERVRRHLIAKLMRQAKPDDVFTFVRLDEISARWDSLEPRLVRMREPWAWWLRQWGVRRWDGCDVHPERPLHATLPRHARRRLRAPRPGRRSGAGRRGADPEIHRSDRDPRRHAA